MINNPMLISFCAVFIPFQFFILNMIVRHSGQIDHSAKFNTKPFFALAGAVFGPIAGIITRPWDAGSVNHVMSIVPYFLPFLILIIGAVMILPRVSGWWKTGCYAVWVSGWVGWMAGAVIGVGSVLG